MLYARNLLRGPWFTPSRQVAQAHPGFESTRRTHGSETTQTEICLAVHYVRDLPRDDHEVCLLYFDLVAV
jgi:hypothetical protein